MSIILAIDSTSDDTVEVCEAFRADEVYPAFGTAGHEVRRLVNGTSTRPALAQALSKADVDMLSGSGHGLPDTFTGESKAPVLKVGQYEAAEVKDKIVHLLACLAGQELGADLVSNGCRAFFGYQIEFAFPLAAPHFFLRCDAEIDLALAEGATAGQAYQRAFAEYTSRALAVQQLGQPHMAAFLLLLRDNLVAPTVDAKWGDHNASLT